MIYFPKKILCALEAVLDIALNARPDPVRTSDLTARQKISKRYLERVMQSLVHADILTGHRGSRGGYRLARDRRHITLGEILRTLEDLDETKLNHSPSALNENILQPLCQQIHQEMLKRFDVITIEDLTHSAEKKGLGNGKEKSVKSDFNI